MDERLNKLELDMLALRALTTSLWANILANGTDRPREAAQRMSIEGREDIGSMLRGPDASQNAMLEETIHELQDRMERFWEGVDDLLAKRDL